MSLESILGPVMTAGGAVGGLGNVKTNTITFSTTLMTVISNLTQLAVGRVVLPRRFVALRAIGTSTSTTVVTQMLMLIRGFIMEYSIPLPSCITPGVCNITQIRCSCRQLPLHKSSSSVPSCFR